MTVREEITPEKRRKAFLKLVRENGYHDGFFLGAGLPGRYGDDEDVEREYKRGVRLGKRERARVRHEV